MGGKSGGTTVIQPATPAPPSPGQSAAEYAAALPTILQAQLQYQPQFNEADYQSFAKLAPLYTSIADQISKQYYPETYGLQESLAKQASEGMTGEVPQALRQQYLSNLNAQLGTNVNAPVGADYVSRGLLDQAQQYRQYYQNLGLSLAGRQPLTSLQYQPSSFDVAGGFGNAFNTQMGGYGAFSAANRPLLGQQGTPNWIPGLNAAGNFLQGLGSFGNKNPTCWVAAACFGGWYRQETHFARYFVMFHTPIWFRNFYCKYGERISRNKILVKILKPLFIMFAKKGRKLAYGK